LCHQVLEPCSVPNGDVAGEIADRLTVDLDRDRVLVMRVLPLRDDDRDYAVSDPLSD